MFYGGYPLLKLLHELSMTLHDDHFAGIIFERILNLISAFPLKRGAPFEHLFEHVPAGCIMRLFKSQSLLDEPCNDPVGYCGVGRVQEYDKICTAEAGADPFKVSAFDDPAFLVDDAY